MGGVFLSILTIFNLRNLPLILKQALEKAFQTIKTVEFPQLPPLFFTWMDYKKKGQEGQISKPVVCLVSCGLIS